MRTTTLVFGVNDAYCLPLVVAWQSLCRSNPHLVRDAQIWVLYEELSVEARDRLLFHALRLKLSVRIRRIELPDLPYNTGFGGARANYLRLAIPKVLGDRDRVLYLDADIVVRGDIEPLLSADLAGMPVAAARDQVNPTVGAGRGLTGWTELGVEGEQEYFNSGVMLIDLAAARDSALFPRALDVVRQHSAKLRLWDQDALNVAVAGQWQRLERKWNSAPLSVLAGTRWFRGVDLGPATSFAEQESDAVILHYLSPAKPWKGLLPSGAANDLYQAMLTDVASAEGGAGVVVA